MSRTRLLLAVAGVALVAASAAAAALWLGDDGGDDQASALEPHQGRFVVDCGLSHTAPDDPIVHPRAPGASHLHEFFGNRDVDAFSEAEDLRGNATTCQTQQDTASYWAPALLRGEDEPERIAPLGSLAYYRVAPGVDPEQVEPFPFGLTLIGGDQTSTEAQSTDVVGWSCGPNPVRHETPPPCQEDNPLTLRITFPDCWDGEDLTSEDHQSHVARSDEDGCPDGHPVAMPQLELVISYPVWDEATDELYLASGSVETAHADFYNAWDEQKLAEEVQYCLRADVVCGAPTAGGQGHPADDEATSFDLGSS